MPALRGPRQNKPVIEYWKSRPNCTVGRDSAVTRHLVESRMRGNAHVRFGGRAGETHITHVAQGAPVRPYYFNVRLQKDRPCVLVVVGATEDGHKELLAIQDGERERHLSWLHLLQDLKARGLKEHSFLAVADTDGELQLKKAAWKSAVETGFSISADSG